jgi:large subunit ribosomal protein L15
MQINNVKRKTPNRTSIEVGRGGKRGKTSGRGQKGQNSRAGHKKRPEMRERIKKLPKLRGYAFKGILTDYVWPVSLATLSENFENGAKVTPSALVRAGVLKLNCAKNPVVKILNTGDITKKITVVGCKVSASAKEKIEKAGGSVK